MLQEHFEPIEAASKSLDMAQNNEILERERKNSKNEINAKLNNQGNFDSMATIFDPKKTFADDNQRKIRRIDLRAYGFENEFNTRDIIKKKQQRIPNKLDLRSFGYDSGLRRTQSNNHLDSQVNNSFLNSKTQNSGRINGKSNLSMQHRETAGDFNWTKSTEELNDEQDFDNFDGIKSAKSVPNIAKIDEYSYNGNKVTTSESDDDEKYFNEEIVVENRPEVQKIQGIMQLIDKETNCETNGTEIEEGTQTFPTLKEPKYSLESLEGSDAFVDKELPMPSVKRLAQAFNKPTRSQETPIAKVRFLRCDNYGRYGKL